MQSTSASQYGASTRTRRATTGAAGSWRGHYSSRRDAWRVVPALLVADLVFFYEAFCLLTVGPRTVVEDSAYRVTIGVSNPSISHLFGAMFLLAAVAVLVAHAGLRSGALWWKTLALGAWLVACVTIVAMLGSEMWSLGRVRIEPSFVRCGWPLGMAQQVDYFLHVEVLALLAFSGSWIATLPRRWHSPSPWIPDDVECAEHGALRTRLNRTADSGARRSWWLTYVTPLVPGGLAAVCAPVVRRPEHRLLLAVVAVTALVMGVARIHAVLRERRGGLGRVSGGDGSRRRRRVQNVARSRPSKSAYK